MKKLLTASLLTTVIAGQAHAGFFDFLSGGSDKEEAAPVAEAAAVPAATTPASTSSTSGMAAAGEAAMGLLPMLTGELGVSESQASGGMGALMQFAQSNLTNNEFSTLSAGVPGMETLLAAAPVLSQAAGSGSLSGAMSSLGGAATALSAMDSLTKQFSALGLDSDMIAQFANLAVQYFSGQGGDTAALLQKGLGALLG